MKKKTITILVVISTTLLLGGTGLLVKDDAQQSRKNAEIRPYAISEDMQDKLDKITEELTIETESGDLKELSETETEILTDAAEIPELSAFPDLTEPEVAIPDTLPAEIYQQLRDAAQSLTEAYPDAVGWLYLPDTNINYPLMQGEDNEFYLHHAYDGSSLTAGSVFLDYRCAPSFLNPVNIVYAHNMKNGSMFAGVNKFKESGYFSHHRYGWLSTADKVYRIDFFSVAVVDWHDSIYDGSQPIFDWMSRLQSVSKILDGISYDDSDKFISLSTCSSEFQNARTVLTGKLVEMNGGDAGWIR